MSSKRFKSGTYVVNGGCEKGSTGPMRIDGSKAEPVSTRTCGKGGTVTARARQEGNQVVIETSCNGKCSGGTRRNLGNIKSGLFRE